MVGVLRETDPELPGAVASVDGAGALEVVASSGHIGQKAVVVEDLLERDGLLELTVVHPSGGHG
jgi:hypothetical protein